MLKKLDNLIYLYLLFPIALISGPLISDLIVSLISLYFLIFYYDKIFFFYKKYLFLKILIIFCILNIFISLFSENIFNSLKNSVAYIRFPLFIMAVSFFLRDNYRLIKYFYFVLLITILILSVDAFIQFFSGENIFGFTVNGYRVSGFFNDEYILGSYLTRITPILLTLFFFINKNEYKLPLILISILSFLTILISGERTAFGISIFFYFLLFFLVIDFDFKKKIFLFVTLIISLIFIFISSEKLRERYIKTTLFQIEATIGNYKTSEHFDDSENKEDLDMGLYNNQHIKHLKVSYEIFKERPFFGHGNRMFAQICFERYFVNDGRCSTHPHNFLAQIFVENGLIGAIFYLSLFFCLTLYCYKAYKKNEKAIVVILLICILSFFPFSIRKFLQ